MRADDVPAPGVGQCSAPQAPNNALVPGASCRAASPVSHCLEGGAWQQMHSPPQCHSVPDTVTLTCCDGHRVVFRCDDVDLAHIPLVHDWIQAAGPMAVPLEPLELGAETAKKVVDFAHGLTAHGPLDPLPRPLAACLEEYLPDWERALLTGLGTTELAALAQAAHQLLAEPLLDLTCAALAVRLHALAVPEDAAALVRRLQVPVIACRLVAFVPAVTASLRALGPDMQHLLDDPDFLPQVAQTLHPCRPWLTLRSPPLTSVELPEPDPTAALLEEYLTVATARLLENALSASEHFYLYCTARELLPGPARQAVVACAVRALERLAHGCLPAALDGPQSALLEHQEHYAALAGVVVGWFAHLQSYDASEFARITDASKAFRDLVQQRFGLQLPDALPPASGSSPEGGPSPSLVLTFAEGPGRPATCVVPAATYRRLPPLCALVPSGAAAPVRATVWRMKRAVFEKVLEYYAYHGADRTGPIQKPLFQRLADAVCEWDRDFLYTDLIRGGNEKEHGMLVDVIMVATALQATDLAELTCAAVADMITGKTPEQIRALFTIENDLTPGEASVIVIDLAKQKHHRRSS